MGHRPATALAKCSACSEDLHKRVEKFTVNTILFYYKIPTVSLGFFGLLFLSLGTYSTKNSIFRTAL